MIRGADPCALPKACKNAMELDGIRAAHRRDGAALTRFLAWLASASPGSITELDAVARLAAMRAGGEHYRGPSFDTISGAGPNGAIVHYRVTEESNRTLEPGTLYLVDSGGQYLDGTTDVTRTVAIGRPEPEHRDRFTRVLRGHIALATARFPRGTSGAQLDTLARQFLWQAGLDYDHGTGHGVGHYLNVHEGPQRISRMGSGAALAPGMVVSNEPGYYRTGAYGIRIENLVAVKEAGRRQRGLPRLRDTDARTHRPHAHGARHADRGRARLARCLSRARRGDARAPARGRQGDARLASCRHGARDGRLTNRHGEADERLRQHHQVAAPEPHRADSGAHGLDPSSRQAACRHRRPADDRARAGAG